MCIGLAGGSFGVGVAIVLHSRPADSGVVEVPPDVTCRGLLAEPGFYAGRVVRLDTVGTQPGASPRELVYRRWAGLPPAVVVRCDVPVGFPPPRYVVGTVEWSGKPPLVLSGARPD